MKVRPFSTESVPKPPISDLTSGALQRILNSGKPLDLEIGSGVGLHPIQYTQRHLKRNLIAIEQTTNKYKKFEGRFKSHNMPSNLLPIHADAVHWISHFLPKKSLENCFILFPNPYPKKKQSNLRWVNMPFMSQLILCLKPGGRIHLATNVTDYAEEALDRFDSLWNLNKISYEKSSNSIHARTHFEKKYLAQNQTIHDLIFESPN